MVTALIADDEAPMRDLLRTRLQQAWPDLQIVAEAANGVEAVELGEKLRPDIAFLDIRMPGLSGIEAARRLYERSHIVFATAYDQYALDAFEQGALDYLLKPVSAERLATTCARLQARLHKRSSADAAPPQDIGQQLAKLTTLLENKGKPEKPTYLRWIQAQVGASLRMVSTREILFFQSDEKYTRVQTGAAEFLIRKTLKELLDELDPDEFWRIHRSTLVRVDAIAEVKRDLRGRQMLKVRGYPGELEVSRNHSYLFQQM
ncbi:two-component system response regulator [Massilia sp. Root133]|uniref:Response regulator n=1 Tax=Massilia cellulosiltytica TaxID=2683234 RepID=A0A7X3G173_9BURK|nr:MULTISPECIES: LytTR family DNA-binding domain-containing protein [Telluria group]KQY18899.1 two-component system response regulator [Massilia sp. Root133]KQZ53548.1 two-component system response regulator [Massilia sp. Root1485]MVW61732.1 response regulator [Telluria cellulosilytica]